MNAQWFVDARAVGVTAGASAPEVLVQGVISKLVSFGGNLPQELDGVDEKITFSLPKELRPPRVPTVA